ncbi:MAG: efflux RND transporter permease subunit, partial [Spirochaetales bacterium]|nr:efflux RND transporter permease subunit [Spirochaetales bacterium]
LAVTVDRKKAAWFGVSTVQIASAVRNAFEGSMAGTFRYGGKEYDIHVRYAKEYRNSVLSLNSLTVEGKDGTAVPLSSLAAVSYQSSAGVIKRQDLTRGVEVWADFKGEVNNKSDILADIDRKIKAMDIPAGYRVGKGEGGQVQDESTRFLIQAFIVALFLIMIVLIAQFGSFSDPAIIIFGVFLSMGGVFWGYALTGQTFVVIMSGIGCIALAGVAVNNCIVLVDYTNKLIKDGIPWQKAVIESGKVRLRPVLLTAVTTVLGMIPMAMGVSFDIHSFSVQVGSEQSEFWKAFAWAMIYGLSFATVMTLVVVPTFLHLKHRFIHRNQNKILEDLRLKVDDDAAAMDPAGVGKPGAVRTE